MVQVDRGVGGVHFHRAVRAQRVQQGGRIIGNPRARWGQGRVEAHRHYGFFRLPNSAVPTRR
jgi:hypothetical protein